MGHIFLKTSELSFSGYAIYRVVENSAPLVEVTRQAFAAPHPERGVTFSPLRPVMHQVQLWESSNGTTLDTLRATIDVDASMNSELQVTFFDIVVDRGLAGLVAGDTGDPAGGTDTYLDARMKDQVFSISQRGWGFLRPEDEYIDQSNIPDAATGQGGFQLIGRTFDPADTYFITIWRSTLVVEDTPTNDFDVLIVSTDDTIDETYYNKLVIASGSGNIQVLTFPDFGSIPDKTRISFSGQYGGYKYLKLLCVGSDVIRFNYESRLSLFLVADERIDLMWKGGVCYVINYDGRAKERGAVYGDYIQRQGTLLADGAEYTQGGMAGLWDWLINEAPANIKTTYSLWNTSTAIGSDTVYTHKGLYAVDLIGGTFRVPLLAGMFERYLLSGDTERTPNNAGGYQHYAIQAHTHGVKPPESNSATGSGKSTTGGDGPEGSGITQFNTSSTGGIETRGKNIGKIALVVM